MKDIIDGDKLLTKAYKDILADVIVNINGDVKYMKDTDLLEDRNDWVKRYTDNASRDEEMTYETDIQTLALMVEQIKRYKQVQYKDYMK